jgi:predicted permease
LRPQANLFLFGLPLKNQPLGALRLSAVSAVNPSMPVAYQLFIQNTTVRQARKRYQTTIVISIYHSYLHILHLHMRASKQ